MLDLDFPDRATDIFKKKLDTVTCMTIQAIYLLKRIDETDRKERNKLQVSRMIRRYYKRFSLNNYHKTYSYQKKLVFVRLKMAYRCFTTKFYEFTGKNMYLNKIDDLKAGIINEIIYDKYTDMKILELKFIVEIDENY